LWWPPALAGSGPLYNRRIRTIPAAVLILSLAALPAAQHTEKIDYAAIAQIRDEGLNRSQVMDHLSWLSDVYGPRLTGGPGITQASDRALSAAAGRSFAFTLT
jgi:hypothetical protein